MQPRFSPEEFVAREEAAIKAQVDDFAVVLENAKSDIAKAICAGADAYSIESKVSQTEHASAYEYLRFVHGSHRYQRHPERFQPLWDGFLQWAGLEGLRIELVSCLPDIVDGEQVGGSYMRIRARPASPGY
jgi:hypothetical protein